MLLISSVPNTHREMTQVTFLPTRPKASLLKWIGNKYKYAQRIASYFPTEYERYVEPFVGTGAVLSTLAPDRAIASDTLTPLIEIWKLLQDNPGRLISYYEAVIADFNRARQETYTEILERYNRSPNGLDLLIISRTCYGGVVRFTRGGKISTPIGPHIPIPPEAFSERVAEWRSRVRNVRFLNQSFVETMAEVQRDDLVYCDPPYVDSQAILYGAQDFSFPKLIELIGECKNRKARVALSIDGKKKSGKRTIALPIPSGLFEREIYLDCGSSMLKRFQNGGTRMVGEDVHERLLLTW